MTMRIATDTFGERGSTVNVEYQNEGDGALVSLALPVRPDELRTRYSSPPPEIDRLLEAFPPITAGAGPVVNAYLLADEIRRLRAEAAAELISTISASLTANEAREIAAALVHQADEADRTNGVRR